MDNPIFFKAKYPSFISTERTLSILGWFLTKGANFDSVIKSIDKSGKYDFSVPITDVEWTISPMELNLRIKIERRLFSTD